VKQRLHTNLAPIDLLTRIELEETLSTKMDSYIRDLYRGVSYHEENGNGDGAKTIAVQGPESGYAWSVKIVAAQLTSFAGAISQPAVPASTVPVQNPNNFPVTVVISGGTATSTSVNGVVVGAGDGTFVVPAYGSISVTYSVAPTWLWTGVASPDTLAVFLGDNLITAPIAAVPATPAFASFYSVQTFTSNVVVLKDSRTITLASSNGIFAYKLISKMVPAEMVAKL